MKKDLTLRLEEKHIETLKNFAKNYGISVSQLISDYVDFIEMNESKITTSSSTPITDSLTGMFHGDVDENDYKKYLEEKYLK